ncbi:MAG: hypothetical protein GY805_05010 [Chloroflexi bacterium]|nr:hypothetical protein [Chloroflexota bacterium]
MKFMYSAAVFLIVFAVIFAGQALTGIVLAGVFAGQAMAGEETVPVLQSFNTINMHKFGVNNDIDTAAAEDVRSLGGDCYWSASAVTTTIVSADADDAVGDTGARTVTVSGLDTNYKRLAETVSLNGTNTVTLTNKFLRVFRASVGTAGITGINEGNLTIAQDGNDVVQIEAEHGQTQTTCYTIPDNYQSARLCRAFLSAHKFSGTNPTVDAYLMARPEGGAWLVKEEGTAKGGNIVFDYDYSSVGCLAFAPKTDIKWRVITVSANNTAVIGTFDFIMVP